MRRGSGSRRPAGRDRLARPAVSVIVVSEGRPGLLARAVTALGQLRYDPFEVVAVACAPGRAALEPLVRPGLRIVENPGTGVAEARNRGIAAAGGAILAFLDDDAVPEPMWLDRLVGAMEATGAAAATGHVRGRNGISWQWRGRAIGPDGFHRPLGPTGAPPPGTAVMLEGTNMALRRAALHRTGGFDSAHRFYLDDSDLSLRLSYRGLETIIVPEAEVHHGFAASRRRRKDRMPLDLSDIGRSLVIFLRKHGGAPPEAVLALHRGAERRRLLRAMVAGLCEPRDIARLLAGFDAGAAEGAVVPAEPPPAVPEAPEAEMIPLRHKRLAPVVLGGWCWSGRRLRREAEDRVREGRSVSLHLFSPSALHHHLRFDDAGYWVQTGGLFGRAMRSEPLVRVVPLGRRLAEETARVAQARGFGESVARAQWRPPEG